MTDEAIIFDTLRFINRAIEPPAIFVNLNETVWWNYDIRKKEHLRRLLFKDGFVNQNMDNKWEFRLTAQGDLALEEADKNLERSFLRNLQMQPDIELFMIENFIKPNPKSKLTTHETDNGIIFLKYFKQLGLIDYDKDDLLHISNDWYVDDPPTQKRWFDTVDKNHPFCVAITDLGKTRIILESNLEASIIPKTNNNKPNPTLNPNKPQTKSIWKNELMLYIIYPLLVLLIGTVFLKILGVI